MTKDEGQRAEDQHGILNAIDAEFYEDLVNRTRRYLGAGASDNELQPESIVQSVLRSAMVKGKIPERSIEDMEQLRAFLIYKSRRKIWDRRRKNRPVSASSIASDGDRSAFENTRPSPDPLPDEMAETGEQNEHRIRSIADAFASMRKEVSGEDWTIVKLRVLDDQPWPVVATIVGRTPGAVRKHFCVSLKPRLAAMLSDSVLEGCE